MNGFIDGMGFEEVKPKKVSEVIYEQIREKILSGELRAGDRLPTEQELIEQFQRSRPSVREALRMLESRNYITIARGSGAVVNKISSDGLSVLLDNMVKMQLTTLEDVMKVRRVVEETMVYKAASNRTEEDMREIDEVLEEGYNAIPNWRRYLDKSLEFNLKIARAAHDELLYMIANMVVYATKDYYVDRLSGHEEEFILEHNRNSYEEHFAIARAISEGDVEKACELNNIHLNRPYTL